MLGRANLNVVPFRYVPEKIECYDLSHVLGSEPGLQFFLPTHVLVVDLSYPMLRYHHFIISYAAALHRSSLPDSSIMTDHQAVLESAASVSLGEEIHRVLSGIPKYL